MFFFKLTVICQSCGKKKRLPFVYEHQFVYQVLFYSSVLCYSTKQS